MKRPGSMTLLVGLILLVTAAGLFLAFVPIVSCPDCPHPKTLVMDEFVVMDPDERTPVGMKPPPPPCSLCRNSFRITVARKWAGTRAWEGKTVGASGIRGFRTANSTLMLEKTGIRLGSPITRKIVEEAGATLLRTGAFRDVRIDVHNYHPSTPGRAMVLITVVENTR